MRKDTLESNYYPGEISFHSWRQKWYISKLWAKINGDEGSGNCAWTKTFKFNVTVKHEKSSFQVSITSNWNAFIAIFISPLTLYFASWMALTRSWFESEEFFSWTRLSFALMTAQLGNLLPSMSSRQGGRGFSVSLSALAPPQVVRSQVLEEKTEWRNKSFNA